MCDYWIVWTSERQKAHLKGVICLNRYLIRLITMASTGRSIHKGLGQYYRIVMPSLDVAGEPTPDQTQNPGRSIRHRSRVQNPKVRLVGDNVSPCLTLGDRPSQPSVAHPHLESPGWPTQQVKPHIINNRHLSSRTTPKILDAHIMTLGH